jgi:hypothetical protein
MEEKTVSQKLDRIIEGFEQQKQKKEFKLPMGIRTKKGKVRKNYAVIQLIRTNGAIEFKMLPIEDNTVKVGDIYYETTAKHVLRYKRYPMIIIPEWNISPLESPDLEPKPFDSQKNLEEAVKEGKLSAAEKFILHAIKMDLVKGKPKVNIGTILIVLIAIGGLIWLLNSLGVIK